ncbi:hypothetical protein [Sporichthya polymorpha]|uniref:hypothetical protein n=1 Tax=Sporichthya polymorpha TaxID=35751 RepID=UPI00035FFA0B|nr:hypothetical protein [Sporichthya polymorpha]
MGTITSIVAGWNDFATENGTVHDNSTLVLQGGAILILVLSLYAAYNVAAVMVNAAKRAVRGTVSGVTSVGRTVARTAGRKPEVAVPTVAVPVPRIAVDLGTGRPIVHREVAKVG